MEECQVAPSGLTSNPCRIGTAAKEFRLARKPLVAHWKGTCPEAPADFYTVALHFTS